MSDTRILVVDDERSTAQLLEYVLRKADYEVECAADGEAGLSATERFLPHLIISDVHMPGIDGLEMCRRIRQIPGFEMIPFIFLSARSQISERVDGLETGADDYIAKPFERAELLARIEGVLRRSEAYHRVSGLDALTELGNREHFEQRLREELYREQRYGVSSTLALVAIDVEQLEELTELKGTAARDAVVRHVGRFLRDNVRALDVPSRFSQSGFIVLMPHTSRDRALIAIERLHEALDCRPLEFAGEPLPVEASFGYAIVDGSVEDMTEMLGQAHAAMMMARRHEAPDQPFWTPQSALENETSEHGEDSDR